LAFTSPALLLCFDKASAASQQALRHCLDQTITLLRDAEAQAQKQAERAELGDAWRDITAHGGYWCERYPQALRNAFSEALQPKKAAVSAPVRIGELTLVDDQQIVDAIESSRLLQHVLPLVERPVSELDALVSTALGHGTVRPELNPMRPEIFAQALRAVVAPNGADGSPARRAWMRHLAQPLGHELQGIYTDLVSLLKNAHVQAAGYRVSGVESSGAPSSRPAPLGATTERGHREQPTERPGSAEPHAIYHGSSLSSGELSQALLRDFLVHGLGPEASETPPQSYYAAVEQELAELKAQQVGEELAQPLPANYRALPAVDRPTRNVGVQSALDAQVWGRYAGSRERSLVRTQLRRDATRVGQVLGLELVRKVVDQVAQDPRLLAPVREAIVALEPSLLRLAMVDPRFLSEEGHAARQLMERVAQRSFKYNDEFASEFAHFFSEVGERFNALNQLPDPDAQPFQRALERLEAGWLQHDAQEQEQQQPAMGAVRFAERRQTEADQIAWTLSSRADLDKVPSVVQDFLFGPWALVMAHARLTDRENQADPQGYAAVITDLLWSVKREVTLKQPAQLFQRLPSLLATLREGLASIGQDPTESEPFFQALMKLHHPVLKLRRARSRQDAKESGSAPLLPVRAPDEPEAVGKRPSEGLPWMNARELDAAGFEETLPTDMAELTGAMPSQPAELQTYAVDATGAAQPARPAAPDADEVLSELREGCWVDLYSKRRWRRAQLVWASSKGTLFMFVSHSGRPHSMTQRICRRLIEERFLRPVRTEEVVTRALKSLEREADAVAQVNARHAAAGAAKSAARSRPAALAG
jgi:hypothetical protein